MENKSSELSQEQEQKWVTTPSGLSYKIIKHAPDGAPKPKSGNTVTVHYTGWLADANGEKIESKKFDSSVGKQPFRFLINREGVIKGWNEGVMDMQVGEKRLLRIPSSLGYGDYGYPPVIPARATLIFEVELLDAR